jgi:hypothetical protein
MSEETTTPATEEKPKPKTGFAVLVDADGNMFVERNPQVFSIPVEREATLVEVRRLCSEILMDLQAQAAAEYTVLRMEAANSAQ